jgi:hypothetical protein
MHYKVKDLINKLKNIDPDMDVVFYCEDIQNSVQEGSEVTLFEVLEISEEHASKSRKDGLPCISFAKKDGSKKFLVMHLSADI